MNERSAYDLSDLLAPNENAAPAGPRNGAEELAASKTTYPLNTANSPDKQDWAAINAARLWVAWREDDRNGSPAKVPYYDARRKARANDPETWLNREAAQRVAAVLLQDDQRGGIGLMLGAHEGHPIGGVDLDSCCDPATGALEPWAAEILDRFGSYAEISPSGEGVKVFFRFSLEDLAQLRASMGTQHGKSWSRGQHHEIALHLGNRYFAFTGRHVPTTPADMRHVDRATLLWLIQEAGPRFKGAPVAGPVSVDALWWGAPNFQHGLRAATLNTWMR